MRVVYTQSNFSRGILGGLARARTDTDIYYKSVKDLDECIILPQGGVRSRFGLRKVAALPENVPSNTVELLAFSVGYAKYVGVFYYNPATSSAAATIYLEDTAQSVFDVLNQPYGALMQEVRFKNVNERIILTHNFYPQRQITRTPYVGAHIVTALDSPTTLTTLSSTIVTPDTIYPIKFSNITGLTSIRPIIISRTYFVRGITFTDPNIAVVSIYDSQENAYANTNPYTFTAATGGQFELQIRFTGADITFRNKPTYDFSPVGTYDNITFTPSALTGSISAPVTITASAPVFTAQHVGGVFEGKQGIVRLTTFTSTTVMSGYTIHDFIFPSPTPITAPVISAISGISCSLEEPAWSATRYYPAYSEFMQNRLAFANTPSLPDGVWNSVTSELYNFDDTEIEADNAISWYPSGGEPVKSLIAARSLLVQTEKNLYSTPTLNEVPLTPESFSLIKQEEDGIGFPPPIFIDNQVFYVDASGINIKNVIWDFGSASYKVNNISVTSQPDVINRPVDSAAYTNPEFFNGALAVFVNEDGTLALIQTLMQEGILAYSRGSTHITEEHGTVVESRFLRVTSSGNRLWFLVERTINGESRIYLEEADFNINMDASARVTGFTGQIVEDFLPHLPNCRVDILVDGVVIPNRVTDEDGSVDLGSAYADVEVIGGANFVPSVTFLPIATIPGTPSNMYSPKNIQGVYLHYYSTMGIKINDTNVPFAPMPVPVGPPQPTTGVFNCSTLSGPMTSDSQITVTQPLPLPMTLLAITYVLEIT